MKVQPGSVNSQMNVGTSKADKADSKVDLKSNDDGSLNELSAKVDISDSAKMINKIKELATPDVDSVDDDKVAHFQKLIDNGEYEIDAAGVADRLVDSHLI